MSLPAHPLDDRRSADRDMRIRRSRDNSAAADDGPPRPSDEPKHWGRLVFRVVFGAISLALGSYGLVLRFENPPSTNSAPTSVSETTGVPETNGPSTPTTTAVTVMEFSASGPEVSNKFTIPASAPEWDIDWSMDCSPSTTFLVSVTGFGHAAGTADPGVIEFGTYESGSSPNYDHGQFQLTVTATSCSWDIAVVLPNYRR
jgi:hypothetical protein